MIIKLNNIIIKKKLNKNGEKIEEIRKSNP